MSRALESFSATRAVGESAKNDLIESIRTMKRSLAEMNVSKPSAVVHGLKNKQKLEGVVGGKKVTLVADTVSDSDWVIVKTESGENVARQAKYDGGSRQPQNGQDKSFKAYAVETWSGEKWETYNDSARANYILELLKSGRL